MTPTIRRAVLFSCFDAPLAWKDILKRTVHEIADDNCAGLAAQLAFYFLLSLFPAMLFLVALAGYLPVEGVLPQLLAALEAVAPLELLTLLRTQLEQIAEGSHGGLLTLGILGAVWSSSAATVAIIDALNTAYDIVDRRPWWKRRIVALMLTIALSLLALLDLALILVGPSVASDLAAWVGLSDLVPAAWAVLRWPLLLLCALLGVDLVYHFAPNRRERWSWITPGAVIATALWIVSSFGFKLYVTRVADYGATYGTIGGVIVTMLWFYVSGLAMLVGAEINAVIEAARRGHADARR
ncbi:MAG: YihY/virulence factor BrkB family protein [Vicinamibacterales bacterium]